MSNNFLPFAMCCLALALLFGFTGHRTGDSFFYFASAWVAGIGLLAAWAGYLTQSDR